VGDALGAPVEFLDRRGIESRFGPNGITDYAEAYGRLGAITDDTQMTLWTAEGLMRANNRFRDRGICHMPSVVLGSYYRWLLTQGEEPPQPRVGDTRTGWLIREKEIWGRRAPGNTCLSALRPRPPQSRLAGEGRGALPPSPSPSPSPDFPVAPNNSKGCGGIMRIAPVGLVTNQPFRFGCEIAALTHGHPTGYLAAGAFAEIIAGVFHGRDIRTSAQHALETLAGATRGGRPPSSPVPALPHETINAIHLALDLAARTKSLPRTIPAELGEGWIAEESLAIALYCALVAPDFRSALILAVNHTGDSDSTGSLIGQLLGARDGPDAIPPEWLDRLEARDIIEHIADDLRRHFVDPPKGPPPPELPPGEILGISWPPPDDLDRYPPY